MHATLLKTARLRAALDASELAALREAKQLALWRDFSYATIYEYLEHVLGYGPRVAHDRLRVADALDDLPLIEDALATGELSYSAVRELTRVASRQTEERWLERVAGCNVRQIEELVAEHSYGDDPDNPPAPAVRRQRLAFEDILPETVAMSREARLAAETEHGRHLDDDELLRLVFTAFLAGGAAEGAVPRPPYQMAITTCKQCKRSWATGGGREHPIANSVVERASCDATLLGDLEAATPARVTSTVTDRMRAQVFARDGRRCAVPGCRSARNLQIHHIVHQAHGGKHALSNLCLLCTAHHTLHHDGLLEITGSAPDQLQFARRAQPVVPTWTDELAPEASAPPRGQPSTTSDCSPTCVAAPPLGQASTTKDRG